MSLSLLTSSPTITSAMDIRSYSDATDREQVKTLWKAVLGYDAPHNEPGLAIDKKLEVDDGLFFVAVEDGSVIGTIMAGYDGHRGWIYSLAVSLALQRRGIGSRLVAVAEKALTERGAVKINLQIADGNESVTAFYASVGFVVEKRVSMGKRVPQNVSTADQRLRNANFLTTDGTG